MYGGGEKDQASGRRTTSGTRTATIVKAYGNMLWMDPGEPEAEKQSLDVFMDVVERYDVDGIHIDDYFYPYPVARTRTRTKSTSPTTRAGRSTASPAASSSRDDWRRENINRMMKQIYEGTKKRKPWVQFGICPSASGKPGESAKSCRGSTSTRSSTPTRSSG